MEVIFGGNLKRRSSGFARTPDRVRKAAFCYRAILLMTTARSGAFASVARSFQGFLLRVLGKWRWCRARISIGCCCLVAFRTKHLGVIEPVAAISSLVMNIETPGSCASCHIILLYGLRPFVRHRRGGSSFREIRRGGPVSNSWHAHKKIPPFSGFGG